MAFSSDHDKAVKTALLSFFFQVKSEQLVPWAESLDEPIGEHFAGLKRDF